ncbi:MAG TPA: hypothetical protein ENJ51_11650 [Leucothrix mucor]|uniref:Uncharacterized protein n=1 Tax=Leucothrix mucor TaxID=45248 RepID=A0A7V2T4K6_LEUMU|nr:hypothetical protein [Leucothrix mucor]
MNNGIKKLLSITLFGLMVSGTAMAEPEAGGFTLNFTNHTVMQDAYMSKVSLDNKMMEEPSFLDLNYDENK